MNVGIGYLHVGTTEQRDELASSQWIELHSIPASQGRIAGYRIGEDQSGGDGTILDLLAGFVASPS